MSNETAIEKAVAPATLASFLQPVGADSAPSERGPQYPYVGFRGAKSSKNLDALNAAGVTVARDGSGSFYLMDPPTPIKLDPFKIHLIQYYRAYTLQDDSGKIVEATFKNDNALFKDGFREHIFGVALVILDVYPGFVPATIQLRGAQTNALKSTIQLLGTPTKPGLLTLQGDDLKNALKVRGSAWEAASAVEIPGARVVTTIWSAAEVPASGGQKFNNGYGTAVPITADHAKKLNTWLAAFGNQLTAVADVNNARFDKVRRIAAGQGEVVEEGAEAE